MTRVSKILPLLIAALFALGPPGPAAFAEGGTRFGLQPVTYNRAVPESRSYFIFDANPGAAIESEVRIVNSGSDPGTVRLYPVDATTGQTSGTVYLSGQEPRQDVGAWLKLGTAELTLQPGESRVIPFSLAVPTEVRPGQHVGGIVAEDMALKRTAADPARPDGAQFQINIRQLTILAVQVNLPAPPVEIVEVSGIMPGGEDGYQQLRLAMRNAGTVMLKPTGTLTVTDSTGQLVQDLKLKLDTFLPQTAIDYPLFLEGKALGVGSYRASLVLTYGDSRETRYTTSFDITAAEVAQVFEPRKPLDPPLTVGNRSLSTDESPPSRLPLISIAAILVALLMSGVVYAVIHRHRRPF